MGIIEQIQDYVDGEQTVQHEPNKYDKDGDGVMDEDVYEDLYADKDISYGTIVAEGTEDSLSENFHGGGDIPDELLQGTPEFGTIYGDTVEDAAARADRLGFNTSEAGDNETNSGDTPEYAERWNGTVEEIREWAQDNPHLFAFIVVLVTVSAYAVVTEGTETLVEEVVN